MENYLRPKRTPRNYRVCFYLYLLFFHFYKSHNKISKTAFAWAKVTQAASCFGLGQPIGISVIVGNNIRFRKMSCLDITYQTSISHAEVKALSSLSTWLFNPRKTSFGINKRPSSLFLDLSTAPTPETKMNSSLHKLSNSFWRGRNKNWSPVWAPELAVINLTHLRVCMHRVLSWQSKCPIWVPKKDLNNIF